MLKRLSLVGLSVALLAVAAGPATAKKPTAPPTLDGQAVHIDDSADTPEFGPYVFGQPEQWKVQCAYQHIGIDGTHHGGAPTHVRVNAAPTSGPYPGTMSLQYEPLNADRPPNALGGTFAITSAEADVSGTLTGEYVDIESCGHGVNGGHLSADYEAVIETGDGIYRDRGTTTMDTVIYVIAHLPGGVFVSRYDQTFTSALATPEVVCVKRGPHKDVPKCEKEKA